MGNNRKDHNLGYIWQLARKNRPDYSFTISILLTLPLGAPELRLPFSHLPSTSLEPGFSQTFMDLPLDRMLQGILQDIRA